MDTFNCSIRRADRNSRYPAQFIIGGAVKGISDKSNELEDGRVSFDDIVLDSSACEFSGSKQAVRKQSAVMGGGYDRNGRRRKYGDKYSKKQRSIMYVVPVAAMVVIAGVMVWAPFASQPSVSSVRQVTATDTVISRPEADLLTKLSSDELPTANSIDTHKVAVNYPRVLSIDSLSVKARIFEVGTDARNHPQLPKNSYDIGWYNVSSLPRYVGATVLSGACSGSVGQGVFYQLGSLAGGEKIELEQGDGTRVFYEVVSVRPVKTTELDMKEVLSPTQGVDKSLNLVGCAGSYDAKTNDFDGRIIVFAKQI